MSIYQQPKWTPKVKETASPKSIQKKKKKIKFSVFISVVAVTNLVLTLLCLVLFIAHFSISQPSECHFVSTNMSTVETIATNGPTEPPLPPLGSRENPASSCRDIPQDSCPGDYWIQTKSNTLV